MCDLPAEWWDPEAESCEDSARSILIHPERTTWTGSPQSGGIKLTPLTEQRGKGRAQPGEEVLVTSGQSMSKGILGRGNSSLLRHKKEEGIWRKQRFFSMFPLPGGETGEAPIDMKKRKIFSCCLKSELRSCFLSSGKPAGI